ncbi:MAG: Na(+)-translocating NADH-quinone reductase subunit A [Lachnospiraceae bacterium]|nr:Na(+)-translocating NADH-quinone reductase subunit A [Lachnospiraceae bacterium]
MVKNVRLKKGLDIRIRGEAPAILPQKFIIPESIALIPDDYTGITPKVDVKEGDKVKIGDPLFHDKKFPDIKVVSPVNGTVSAVVRGERRKLERIVVAPEKEFSASAKFEVEKVSDPTKAQQLLLDSGLWAWLRQRPYNVIPEPGVTPRDIFVTGFDSAPLAPDYEMLLKGYKEELDAAVKLLNMLTSGKIYIGIRGGSCLTEIEGTETVIFEGPHPAGNPSVQICNVKPVNKGDIVWTLDALTLLRIGKLVKNNILDMTTTVALTGCEVTEPHYVSTVVGCDMSTLTKGEINDDIIHHRIISGNVLTGHPTSFEGYLRFPYNQVTVIAEGDDYAEFMGWASLSPQKMSVSRSFPGHFTKKLFCPDARILGGRRAMIMSGVYEKMLPMDILPEFLIKAILAKDIDKMEQLGIYEVAPEDFALCEYVDPSKLELQKIVYDGLEYMRKELN